MKDDILGFALQFVAMIAIVTSLYILHNKVEVFEARYYSLEAEIQQLKEEYAKNDGSV